MRLNRFLIELEELGEVQVEEDLQISDEELVHTQQILLSMHESRCLQVAKKAPDFDFFMAGQSLRFLYKVCQFLVYREFGEEELHGLRENIKDWSLVTASQIWSADLLLCHLPRIAQMAKELSDNDPLLEVINEVAQKAVLSSVGMKCECESQQEIFNDDCLTAIYIDRIIEQEDVRRLLDEGTFNIFQAKVGLHDGLCQKLLEKLEIEKGKE